ncbi:unnamed protein product [Parnassius apollo]|uniref:(apollo) hypothetical protein n=1 Tax=Parnassius apollo TaxID=110799 RepID=A0A8S3X121_PARAO|nr:unnamed protein product [Parnassius apollo]
MQKLTERIDDLKQKIAAWGKRIRRFSERSRQFNQNHLFQSDQKRLYKSLERPEVCGAGPGPDQADTVAFWRGLWSEPINHSEGPLMEVVVSQSASVTHMDPVTITPENVAKAVRRAPNWKNPGLDGLHHYWLKGFVVCHAVLARQFQEALNQKSLPSLFTTGITHLVPKDQDTTDPSKYHPITENEYEPIINDVKGHSLLEENNNSLEDISLSPRRSLPDLSTRDYDDEYIQLKQKIEELNSKLASAHTEIENLHMEKNIYITDFLREIGYELDVICLSETFLKAGEEVCVHLNGYTIANSYSRLDVKRGGVCILCKNNFNFVDLTIINKYQAENTFEKEISKHTKYEPTKQNSCRHLRYSSTKTSSQIQPTKRYRKSRKRREDNALFTKNEKLFYLRLQQSVNDTSGLPTRKEEVEKFWRSIWSEKVIHNETATWITREEQRMLEVPEMQHVEITE